MYDVTAQKNTPDAVPAAAAGAIDWDNLGIGLASCPVSTKHTPDDDLVEVSFTDGEGGMFCADDQVFAAHLGAARRELLAGSSQGACAALSKIGPHLASRCGAQGRVAAFVNLLNSATSQET